VKKRTPRRQPPHRRARAPRASAIVAADAREIDALRRQLARAARTAPSRWNANPDDVQRSVIQLVLTLVEFIRKILERQAIRRLETRTLTRKQTEQVGLALMRLEETIRDLASQFDLDPEDLNLDLGPLGRLM
jgi:hypothetical protein